MSRYDSLQAAIAEVLRVYAATSVGTDLFTADVRDRVAEELAEELDANGWARLAEPVEKASAAPAPTATPQPALTVRQQRLLAEIRQRPDELRSTTPVGRLYRTWHIHTPDQEARRDLAHLAKHGYLTQYTDDTGRRYRLNTQKDDRP